MLLCSCRPCIRAYLILTGIRNFVVGVTVKVASDEVAMRKEKAYINKLNLALVQVRLTLGVLTEFNCHPPDSQAGMAS